MQNCKEATSRMTVMNVDLYNDSYMASSPLNIKTTITAAEIAFQHG